MLRAGALIRSARKSGPTIVRLHDPGAGAPDRTLSASA
jgi:hypothetical protein